MPVKTARSNDRPSENSRVESGSVAEAQPMQDFIEYARNYARSNPEAAALWCFGIGFILGWKLKPW